MEQSRITAFHKQFTRGCGRDCMNPCCGFYSHDPTGAAVLALEVMKHVNQAGDGDLDRYLCSEYPVGLAPQLPEAVWENQDYRPPPAKMNATWFRAVQKTLEETTDLMEKQKYLLLAECRMNSIFAGKTGIATSHLAAPTGNFSDDDTPPALIDWESVRDMYDIMMSDAMTASCAIEGETSIPEADETMNGPNKSCSCVTGGSRLLSSGSGETMNEHHTFGSGEVSIDTKGIKSDETMNEPHTCSGESANDRKCAEADETMKEPETEQRHRLNGITEAFFEVLNTYLVQCGSRFVTSSDDHDLRNLLIVMECPLLSSKSISGNAVLTGTLGVMCVATSQLPKSMKDRLAKWISVEYSHQRLRVQLSTLQTLLSTLVISLKQAEVQKIHLFVASTARTIGILHKANEMSGEQIPVFEFYNEVVNQEVSMKKEVARWKSTSLGFSFCETSFLLDPGSKCEIMRRDSEDAMERELMCGVLQGILTGSFSPYLVVKVRRNYLVQDTLAQLMGKPPQELKKQLKVVFANEPGVDEGGVKKEFFQLLIEKLFSPEYFMFSEFDEGRMMWFNSRSFEAQNEFELVGKVLGLAVYNGVILDVHFPLVAYRKLLRPTPSTMEDLKELDPSLYRGFKSLLDFDGDVETTFARNFTITETVFGDPVEVELKENGTQIPVTKQNREEFVSLYATYLLDRSVSEQFESFSRGFHSVCSGDALKLFIAKELELLVCGSPVLDFHALEEISTYADGYTRESDIVSWLWDTVHALSQEEKKRFLAFCTGSDRAPVRGLGSIKFFVIRQGPDSDRLPTAHTCFNYLLIPEYSTKEKLERLLKKALDAYQGFGLM